MWSLKFIGFARAVLPLKWAVAVVVLSLLYRHTYTVCTEQKEHKQFLQVLT